jgi:H3 lysine-79-specific histone-lysine N-methyltransferase
MNFFGANKKSGIKPAPPKIRVERVPGERKLTPIPSKLAAEKQSLVQRSKHSPARSSPSSSRSSPATPPSDRHESGSLMPGRVVSGGRKRKPSRQKSPTTYQHLESDSEDDGSATDFDDSYKRPKLDNRPVDLKRKLRSRKAFSDQDGGVFKMIHAADLKTEEKKPKLAAGMTAENVTVELQYPSASQRERYVASRSQYL